MVTWDEVEHAESYNAGLYIKDGSDYKRAYPGTIGSNNFRDFADYLGDGYEYYVRVKTYSNDINSYAHSEWSEYIPFDKNNATDNETDNVNGKLDNIIGNVTTDNAQAAVNSVKGTFADAAAKRELQVAMQTDDSTRAKIEDLETKYKASMNIETKVNPQADIGIDASSVKLLGAALNATQAGSVSFNMSKPDEAAQKDLITNTGFTKAIVLDLELEGAGITKGQALAIPVTITMNPPAGIDVNKLTILHYNADNTSYETLPVRLNSDGTISFTVTHFSNFVFGEQEQSQGSTASGNKEVGGTGDTYYDATEDISNALAQATEEMIRIEEAIPVTAFFSAEAVNALPTEVKENVATNNTIYNLSKITTTQGFISAVDKIIKSDQTTETITFYSSKPFAFNAKSLAALTNANRGFVYMFNHQGHLYKITIPAGAKVDLAGQSFAGPLYIGAQLGTSVLVK